MPLITSLAQAEWQATVLSPAKVFTDAVQEYLKHHHRLLEDIVMNGDAAQARGVQELGPGGSGEHYRIHTDRSALSVMSRCMRERCDFLKGLLHGFNNALLLAQYIGAEERTPNAHERNEREKHFTIELLHTSHNRSSFESDIQCLTPSVHLMDKAFINDRAYRWRLE